MDLPQHLAIIMDGNGRWAQKLGRPRTFGHLRGARIAKKVIETCAEMGVKRLTLYAFSTENWLRPESEVSFLMSLLGRHLNRERANLMKNKIRFSTIGDLSRLPTSVVKEVEKTVSATENCSGMELVFALSYGGRQEITDAVRAIASSVKNGSLDLDQISESLVSHSLQCNMDVDLMIRTSGECRLSGFLPWQSTYAELYFTQTLWPDFSVDELWRAFEFYSSRQRRFGKTSSQVEASLTQSQL